MFAVGAVVFTVGSVMLSVGPAMLVGGKVVFVVGAAGVVMFVALVVELRGGIGVSPVGPVVLVGSALPLRTTHTYTHTHDACSLYLPWTVVHRYTHTLWLWVQRYILAMHAYDAHGVLRSTCAWMPACTITHALIASAYANRFPYLCGAYASWRACMHV